MYEPYRSEWREDKVPEFHAPGPTKMYLRSCFEAIGGLSGELGWDTLDETSAAMNGCW